MWPASSCSPSPLPASQHSPSWTCWQAPTLWGCVGLGAWAASPTVLCSPQLTQALSGRFNSHVHVEYEWRLLNEDLDESDDDVDEKLQVCARLPDVESPSAPFAAVWLLAYD